MSYIEAGILGLVQGLCEFLPVSSSGHLVIFQNIFGQTDAAANLLFDVMLHLATLIAVFIAFRKRILKLIVAFFTIFGDIFKRRFSFKKASYDQRMVIFIIIATIPLFFLVPFADVIETLFSSMLLVGVALLITAAMLTVADRVRKDPPAYGERNRRAGKRTDRHIEDRHTVERHIDKHSKKVYNKTPKEMTVGDSLVIGLFQAVALTPGISRSGATISGGLVRGLSRESAVEFSFIMSIPAVLGSAVLNIKDAIAIIPTTNLGPCLLGMAIALVAGLAAIKLISFLVKKDKFGIFAYYCAAMGIFAIVYSFIK